MFILSRQTDTASAVSSNWCVDVDDVPLIRETTMGIINNFVQFHSIVVNANHLKYISLITLTLQNAILGLSMRYARTRPGDIFLSSTGKLTKINNSGDDWEGVPSQRRLDFVLNFFFNFFCVTDLSSHLLFNFYGYDERRCFFLLDSGSVFFRKYMVAHKALPIFIFMEIFIIHL